MKKIISIAIMLLMVVSLSACGGKVTLKDALINTSDAKQANMVMSVKLSTKTAGQLDEIKMLLNSVYGTEDDSKKVGLESTLTATYKGQSLEGKMDLDADLSQTVPKISLSAGVPASTMANFSETLPTAMVITLDEADFSKIMKEENVDFNNTLNAETIKNNADTLEKVLKAFNELKIEDPKDEGKDSITLEGKTYDGEKYTALVTGDQFKGMLKAFAKIGTDMEKKTTKTDTTKDTKLPSDKEMNDSIDQAFKTISFNDGIKATMLVDKDGNMNYMATKIVLTDATSKTDITLDLAIGYNDLNSSVKGLDYYNKNKTGMYKDATVIPIMKYIEAGLKSGSSKTNSLLNLGN